MISGTPGASHAADLLAPKTRSVDVVDEVHGEQIADPYRWLEDGQAPETRDWIEAQNRRTTEFLAKFPGRKALAKRAKELLKVDSIGIPTVRGQRYSF